MTRYHCACLAILVCIGLAAQEAAAAAPPAPPDLELFFRHPVFSVARLSPSGEYLAIVSRASSERYVAVVLSTADPQKAAVVARSDVADVIDVSWAGDQRLVVVTADLQASHDLAGFQLGVFAVDRDGSESTHLISGDWNYRQDATGSSMKRRMLPRKFVVLGMPDDGTEDIIVGEREFANADRHLRRVTPFRLNTRTQELTPLLDDSLPGLAYSWLFDESGTPRVFTEYVDDRRIIYVRNSATKQWQSIGNFDAVAREGFIPQFLGFDGALYVTQSDADGYSALYRYDMTLGALSGQPLVSVKGFDFSGGPEVDAPARKLLGFHYTADARGTAWLDPKFRHFQERIDAALPATTNVISCGHCLASRFLLVAAASDRLPLQYWLFDKRDEKLVEIGQTRPGLKPAQMGERNFYHFTARDGLSIPVYVTLPPGRSPAPPPAVVLVHGGPWVRGTSWEWVPDAQFLASRGYAVIQPEFRGSTGYGFKLFQAGWRQWGLTMQDDLADAARWAVGKGYADPKRIAIAGASYGGYATLMGLIKDPEIFRCGFEWVGVTDIGLMYTIAWNDATESAITYGMPRLIGDRQKDAAQLKATSPLANAARLTQPLLMAYGDKDQRVPVLQGTRFRDAVSATNKRVEWIEYALEGHGWYLDEDNIDFWKHVESFLRDNLAPAP